MNEDEFLRYDKMVEKALRGVVRSSVEEVMEHGLLGDHHFYITFITDYPGVKIPEYLKDRYPGEMTIVLQYQFSDLAIKNECLEVSLSFNNIPEKLIIPLAAISIFADPSVNFALQFQPLEEDSPEEEALLNELDDDDGPDDGGGGGKSSKGDKTGEVISLDNFRKK
ncbi:MAG: ClpXP protease specificity-enhancing factor SspB [Alphaproteobacteria bacterium]|nr:ClpXP protease specificity-enhancing factor SspB [Alphaproteobacteria bacterium]